MSKVATAPRGALLSAVLVSALLVSFFVVRSAYGSSTSAVRVVQTAKNPTLKKTVLVTRKGLTLY
jgi:hypothetical protein